MSSASPLIPRVRIGTWNTEFAKPGGVRGERVRPILAAPECDILCVTEGYAEIFPNGGHTIAGGDDPCYPLTEGQRNVLLWSKEPWKNVESGLEMPKGGFVAGTTTTPIGRLTVMGVCIPWHFACVATGCKNRPPWEVHLDWLSAFRCWLSAFRQTGHTTASRGTVVLGDFNQWIPRSPLWPPKAVSTELRRAFKGLQIPTRGALPWKNADPRGASTPNAGSRPWEHPLKQVRPGSIKDQLIDHVAHTRDLALLQNPTRKGSERIVGIFPRRTPDPDKPLSDHYGVWADFVAK